MKTESNATHAGLLNNADDVGLGTVARVGRTKLPSSGPRRHADGVGLTKIAATGLPNASGDGLYCRADHVGLTTSAVAARATLIVQIRSWHRERVFAMDQRKRLQLALGAFLRRKLGWHKDLPKPQRDKIAKTVAAMIKAGTNAHVIATSASCEPWQKIEREALRAMEKLAEQLPVWGTFGKPINGFGRPSLAVIVAEAGDLSNYSTHSKLWKRLGLAVFEGRRQGQPIVKTAEEWLRHGYSPRRRSLVWNIGDSLIKKQNRYRTLYLKRKAYELARDPTMKPIVAHRRAQRYMEKKLIRDLWSVWRKV